MGLSSARPMLARTLATASFVLLAMIAGGAALAQSAADFYARRNVNLVIGYSAGGGYDLYARFLARGIPTDSAAERST